MNKIKIYNVYNNIKYCKFCLDFYKTGLKCTFFNIQKWTTANPDVFNRLNYIFLNCNTHIRKQMNNLMATHLEFINIVSHIRKCTSICDTNIRHSFDIEEESDIRPLLYDKSYFSSIWPTIWHDSVRMSCCRCLVVMVKRFVKIGLSF